MDTSYYFIKFGSEKECKDAVNYVKKRLRNQGLKVDQGKLEDEIFFVVSAPKEMIVAMAEELEMIKPLLDLENAMEFTVGKQSMFHQSSGEIFTSSEKIWVLYRILQSITFSKSDIKVKKSGRGRGLLTYLKTCHPPIIVEDYPLHSQTEKGKVVSLLKNSIFPWKTLDLAPITGYFGEEIGFYFAWMNFYSRSILVPLFFGVLMFLLRPKGCSVDNDAYLPFYSIVVAIWAVLFLVFWQRQSAVHSFHWNTYNLSLLKEHNPEFHGTFERDPVTDEVILCYPQWKRRLWYCFSFLAMLPLLLAGVLVMTLSLNLNGYVKDTNSPIYVGFLAEYAKPGGAFAADSPYYGWLVPTIAHSILISIINAVYSSVAEKCTDLENHRTVREWQNSVIVKRVFFECFDCFMPLFYIAFYQLDVVTLRAELISLFMSDEIRRVILESILPFLKELLFAKKMERKEKKDIPYDVVLNDYDLFDDYLEMVIQFGYITLFASAFTLGPLVTFLFLYVELRSDLFKILYAYKRPLPRRVKDIGVWFDVMRVMVVLSVLTNCAILGFSSEQLMQWLPWMFTRQTNDGDQELALGRGRYVVGIVFGAEHLILLLAAFLQWVISPVPKWVRIAIARRDFLKHQRRT